MFPSQFRELQRQADVIDANNQSKFFDEFIVCVKKHDYSYMMSDDDRVWRNGMEAEKHIQSLIEKLISFGYNAHSLKLRTLDEVKQQYNDVDSNGNDLTHRVIRNWFAKYENK
jgi:hypothetical protein